MHNEKLSRPSGVVKEHFEKSLHGIKVLHPISNNVLLANSTAEGWKLSNLIPIYQGKESVMLYDLYQG